MHSNRRLASSITRLVLSTIMGETGVESFLEDGLELHLKFSCTMEFWSVHQQVLTYVLSSPATTMSVPFSLTLG